MRRLLSDAVLSRVSLTDAEIDAYCREHARDFDRPERIRLRQILVPTPNEARDVVRRLKKDPKSFATLAQTRSRGPGSEHGGSDGHVQPRGAARGAGGRGLRARRGRDERCGAEPPGISRAEGGGARSRAARPAFRECREAARAELLRQKSDTSVREFVQGLMARAKVNHEAVTGSRPS